MSGVKIDVARVAGRDPEVPLPSYETEGAAGMDLRANLRPEDRTEGLTLASGERALVPTGIALGIPAGWEVQIRPRSGLALKRGVTLVNAPGTIDSDYRGEIGVILINHGAEVVTVAHGERVAQMVAAPVARATLRETAALDGTARGAGGFGSTGSGADRS